MPPASAALNDASGLAETWLTPAGSPVTWTGESRSVVVPSPSWPWSFSPQAKTTGTCAAAAGGAVPHASAVAMAASPAAAIAATRRRIPLITTCAILAGIPPAGSRVRTPRLWRLTNSCDEHPA